MIPKCYILCNVLFSCVSVCLFVVVFQDNAISPKLICWCKVAETLRCCGQPLVLVLHPLPNPSYSINRLWAGFWNRMHVQLMTHFERKSSFNYFWVICPPLCCLCTDYIVCYTSVNIIDLASVIMRSINLVDYLELSTAYRSTIAITNAQNLIEQSPIIQSEKLPYFILTLYWLM